MNLGLGTRTQRARFTLALMSVACLFCRGTTLCGQSLNASVAGRVVDRENAVIVGAEITITNPDTKVHYAGQTNQDGLYLVSDIQPGIYVVQVSKPGFKVILNPDVVLHIEAVVALNFTMTFGSITESVTVLGGAPPVNTESSSMGTVIEAPQVTDFPPNAPTLTHLALPTHPAP